MIVVDIETSGVNSAEHGLWQIGAVDLDSMEEFVDESRIDDEDKVDEGALRITGKTENELRDKNKQTQKELINKFLVWRKGSGNQDLICHNPQFDHSFIKDKSIKYFREDPFFVAKTHRAFDLHTIAQIKFFELNGRFLTKENHSDMGLKNILKFCGIEDARIGHDTEGTPHNALEDAKLTAECFSRLVYGKKLFPEFSKFEIPQELRK